MNSISKILSDNDTGKTGSHQAGILVPKSPAVLRFFPPLDRAQKNPRAVLRLTESTGKEWRFTFIYYNNSLFGGTRDEYRLTHISEFIRSHNLKAEDEVILSRDEHGTFHVSFRRRSSSRVGSDRVLRLRPGWKVLSI
jgi:hypothetical protein